MNTFQRKLWKASLFVGAMLSCSLFSLPAEAQVTLQLPTIRVFNIQTVVSAPDGGSAYMGGVNRYSAGQSSRGVPGLSNVPMANRLFRNRAIGSTASSSGSRVHVQIISLQEMGEDVMAIANARNFAAQATDPNGSPEIQKKADFISRNIGRKRR